MARRTRRWVHRRPFSPFLLSSPPSLSHTFLAYFVRLPPSHLSIFSTVPDPFEICLGIFTRTNECSRVAATLASSTRMRRWRRRVRSFVNFLERGQRGTIPTESPISAWCMLIYQESLLLFFFFSSLPLLLPILLVPLPPLLPLSRLLRVRRTLDRRMSRVLG